MNNGKASRGRRFYMVSGAVLWILALGWFIFPPSKAAVEQLFSLFWYRRILSFAIPLTQPFQTPIVGILVAAGMIALAAFICKAWLRGKTVLMPGLKSLFLILPLLWVWFIAFWGAGYHRIPLLQRLELPAAPVSDEEADKLRRLLLQNIRRDLAPPQERDVGRAVASISVSMAKTVESWDRQPIVLPSRVKAAHQGWLLSVGVGGVCSPFTLEALVDGGLPDAAFVCTAAHELGHIAGLCAEDEASFAGYAAGIQAGDPFARYACALGAYVDLAGRLDAAGRKFAFNELPTPAKRDLIRWDEAVRNRRIELFSKIGWRAYDQYLKTHGIREGVANYSRGILLLCYGWRKGLVKLGTENQ